MVYVLEGELTFDGTWSTVQSCGALSVRYRISREPSPELAPLMGVDAHSRRNERYVSDFPANDTIPLVSY